MTVRSRAVYVLGVAFLCLATKSAVAQAPSWNLTGNSSIDANNDFLGTTDSQPLIIRTKDAERLRVDGNGNVGIFDSNPTARLSVVGEDATTDIETKEILRLTRHAVGGVKNRNSAGFLVGAFEPGILGQSRLDINLSGMPNNNNVFGLIPDVNVMTLLANGNVGIGIDQPTHKLQVNGDASVEVLTITGGDIAEPFVIEANAAVRPGMVVAIDPLHPGQLRLSDHSYDHKVAGIVAGANGNAPGIILASGHPAASHGFPVALTGRVYAWADAKDDSIEPGDLLTTSDNPGHAMKVKNYTRAQGAIIGKAMSALPEGTGLVLVLVSLQ